ncbi:MAG: zinc ribbon domain-containing protein [Erysipelotrichaceae bacterium]
MNQNPNRNPAVLVLLLPLLFIFFIFMPFGNSLLGGIIFTVFFQFAFIAIFIAIIVKVVRRGQVTPQNFAQNYRPISQSSVKGQINPAFFPVIGIFFLVLLFFGFASESNFILIFLILFSFIFIFASAIHFNRTGVKGSTKTPDAYQDPFAIQRKKAYGDTADQAAFTVDSKSRYADKAEQSSSNVIEKSRYADKAEQSAFSVSKTSDATQKADHRAMTFDKSLTDLVRKDQSAYNSTRSSDERKGDAVRNAGYYGMRKVGPNSTCLSCGKPVSKEDIYCKNCGKALF